MHIRRIFNYLLSLKLIYKIQVCLFSENKYNLEL